MGAAAIDAVHTLAESKEAIIGSLNQELISQAESHSAALEMFNGEILRLRKKNAQLSIFFFCDVSFLCVYIHNNFVCFVCLCCRLSGGVTKDKKEAAGGTPNDLLASPDLKTDWTIDDDITKINESTSAFMDSVLISSKYDYEKASKKFSWCKNKSAGAADDEEAIREFLNIPKNIKLKTYTSGKGKKEATQTVDSGDVNMEA